MNGAGELIYSAHSLQSYVDCQRRFELNYLQELKWPAVESEPLLASEQHMDDGRRFHEMIHRDLLGVDLPAPSARRDPDIARWWQSFQDFRPPEAPGAPGASAQRYVEKQLVGELAGRTLVATCDLITLDADGKARIYDWKTWRRRHSREWLADRLQTRVYPFLLTAAAATGIAAEPAQIEMIYWYAEFPDDSEVFVYDAAQCEADRAYLATLVEEIAAKPVLDGAGPDDPEAFPMTADQRQCAYCAYRSFCDRGAMAGNEEETPPQAERELEPVAPLLADLDDYDAVAF